MFGAPMAADGDSTVEQEGDGARCAGPRWGGIEVYACSWCGRSMVMIFERQDVVAAMSRRNFIIASLLGGVALTKAVQVGYESDGDWSPNE